MLYSGSWYFVGVEWSKSSLSLCFKSSKTRNAWKPIKYLVYEFSQKKTEHKETEYLHFESIFKNLYIRDLNLQTGHKQTLTISQWNRWLHGISFTVSSAFHSSEQITHLPSQPARSTVSTASMEALDAEGWPSSRTRNRGFVPVDSSRMIIPCVKKGWPEWFYHGSSSLCDDDSRSEKSEER